MLTIPYGSAGEARTLGQLLQRQLLYQLSYCGIFKRVGSSLLTQVFKCSGLQHTYYWRDKRESNPQRSAWKADDLPLIYYPVWRSRRESNPRAFFTPFSFQDCSLRRLGTAPFHCQQVGTTYSNPEVKPYRPCTPLLQRLVFVLLAPCWQSQRNATGM